MMKTIAAYFFIVFGIAVMWASTSRTAMGYISDKRDGVKWWCTYPCKHGDLVSMSYLDFVKKFNPDADNTPFKRPDYNGPKNTVLYLDGDSYTWYWHLQDTNFAGVNTLHYIDRYHGAYYHLDTTKKNILLIEITERLMREYFSTPKMMDEVVDSAKKKKSLAEIFHPNIARRYASLVPEVKLDEVFNKNINQNLQCNLFNYNFIIPMFEYKAALNYYLFNRASGDVVISNDRNFLFLKATVNKTDISSSYGPLTDDEIRRLVDNLNQINDHYLAEGFSAVYLSIIPNSATIMQPEGYNMLIPKIQYDPRLRMKVVDVYAAFNNTKDVLYHPGDTHWNKRGIITWIEAVNKYLVREAERK